MAKITTPGRPPRAPPNEPVHWLVKPRTIRGIWVVYGIILVLLVSLDLVVHRHVHFGFDGVFGFFAWYGFGACVLMVVVAKGLGAFLKRPDTYYRSAEDPSSGGGGKGSERP